MLKEITVKVIEILEKYHSAGLTLKFMSPANISVDVNKQENFEVKVKLPFQMLLMQQW